MDGCKVAAAQRFGEWVCMRSTNYNFETENLSSQANPTATAAAGDDSFTTEGLTMLGIFTIGAAIAMASVYRYSQQQSLALLRREGVAIQNGVNFGSGKVVPYSRDCIYRDDFYDCSHYYYY